MGVPRSTCTVAVYVRLGILPLRYHLSLRTLVWYLRCYHGKASLVVQKQLFHLYSRDEDWMNTCFYQPSYLMLKRLSRLSGADFWSVPLHKVANSIRDSMFLELSIFWDSVESSDITHLIHPQWCHFKFSRKFHSRPSSVQYHSCVLGRAHFRSFLHRCGKTQSPNCRFGCNHVEDISHVFFVCPHFDSDRKKFK